MSRGAELLRIYVVWMIDKQDEKFNQPRKFKAHSHEEAKRMASCYHRMYKVGESYILPDFYKKYPKYKKIIF